MHIARSQIIKMIISYVISQMELPLMFLTTLLLTATANPVMTRQSLLKQLTQEQLCAKSFKVHNLYYSFTESRNISGIPADMNVHWKTGNVYYTLISEEMKMSLQVLHNSGEIEAIKLSGLGQSTAVDNLNDIVYIATDNGVYKYKDDGTIEPYAAQGEDVMYVAVTTDGTTMYIATWPQNRVHVIRNDGKNQETFPAIPNGHGLTVDMRNNIYFVASKTSYILKTDSTIPIKIKGLPSDKMTGIFVSRSDKVFGMDEDSNMYLIDPDNVSAQFVGAFGVTGVNTFGMDASDNVFIGVKQAIKRFNAMEKSPCDEYVDKS